ncbi:MAG TPA: two-component regulator propeller domain-containing protein [Bacteroidales bacterium]|nr:two-component regulator propeller domain-containing protein [Bacteroidales bacterium]
MGKKLCVSFAVLCLLISARSQNLSLKFQHIGSKEGLSQTTISGIAQDKYGFLWIGTQDGLNKYDGYEFKVFKHEPSNPYSISDSYILSLYRDSKDNIWIGTEIGLNRYDFKTERFIRYNNNADNRSPLEYNSINRITESKSTPGLLWLCTNHGISSFDIITGQFTNWDLHFSDSLQQLHHPKTALYESSNELGILWVGTSNGLFRFDTETNSFERYIKEDGLCSNYITSIYEDPQQKIWIGTNNGLNVFNRITKTFISYKHIPGNPTSIAGNNINTVFEDSHHNLWIGTQGSGLNLFNRETNHFTKWTSDPGNPMSISDNSILNIFEDESGILWVGTEGNGMNKVNTNYENIGYFYHDPNNPNSLVGSSVRSIIIDNQNLLWVGTDNGISIYDEQTGKYTHLLHDPDNPNSLGSNQIRVIHQDKNGIFWIGTRDRGFDRYDPLGKTFKHFIKDFQGQNSINSNNVREIYEDDNGIFWIGTVFGGLNRFDPKTETFKHYYYVDSDTNTLNDNRVYSICKDKHGMLWIATGNGIAKFDPQKEIFKRYLADPNDMNKLSHHLLMGVTEDHYGFIWIGTYGRGLNKLDPETGTFTRYTEADGLPNNVAYGIIEDKNFNIWISTNYGISKFNPLTEQFTNFNIANGLQENEFNAGAYYKSPGDEIYFGGINGLNVFDPEKIKHNLFVPPVIIHEFLLFNKSVSPADSFNGRQILTKSILETDTIRLTHRENVFSFNFTALDFSFPERNEYAYILENFETEWNRVGARRFVTYTSLSPGEYTFHVIGSSSDGVWNEEGRSIQIIIIPPWWKTKAFYLLLFSTVILLVYIYIRTRLSQLNKEKSRLEKRVKERTQEISRKNLILKKNQLKLSEANATKDKFFSIIAHDLLNPFGVILGLSDILNSEYDDIDMLERKNMINEIDKSSKLTYQLLENLLTWSRSQRGKIQINKERFNLKELVTNSVECYMPGADKKNLQIINNISDKIEIEVDKFTISMVINNIINNAIKFTPKGGKITISALTVDDRIKLIVQDTGIGMSQETVAKLFRIDESYSTLGTNKEKGTGLGLIICKEFIEMNKGSIEVKSEAGKGSSFIIYLPKRILSD